MFKLNDVVVAAAKKLGKGEELTPFEQIMFERTKKENERRQKMRSKFEFNHEMVRVVETNGKQVPVWRFNGHDQGKKYTGAKLRKLRAERAKNAEKDFPELKGYFVDLWKPAKREKEPTLSRQQLRAMQREVLKCQ